MDMDINMDIEFVSRCLGKNKLSPKRVEITELNSHLVCVLCGGYFVEATTITECLHTFCRSCIVKYVQQNRFCPICDVQVHHSKPWESLRPDKIIQDIVYKLVPGMYHNEMARRREFYSTMKGEPDVEDEEERGLLPYGARFYAQDDSISLSLEYYSGLEDDQEEKDDQNLKSQRQALKEKPKRYLQCPAAVTIRHLKKFVWMKYGIGDNSWVDILYNDESLPEDFSLIDVAYTYSWKRTSPMRLCYRIFRKRTVRTMEPVLDVQASVVEGESSKTKQQPSLEQQRKQSEYLENLNLNPTNSKLYKNQTQSKSTSSGDTLSHRGDEQKHKSDKQMKSSNKLRQTMSRGILKKGSDYDSNKKNKSGWNKNKNRDISSSSNSSSSSFNNNNTTVKNNNTSNEKKSKRDENLGKTVKIFEGDKVYHPYEDSSSSANFTMKQKESSKVSSDDSVDEPKSLQKSAFNLTCLEEETVDSFTAKKFLRSQNKYDEKKEKKRVEEEFRGEKRRRSTSCIESYAEDKRGNSFKRRKSVAADEYSLRRESETKASKSFPEQTDSEESNGNLKSEALRKVFVSKEKPDGNSKKEKDMDSWRMKRKKSKHHDIESKRRKSEDDPGSPSILTFASDPLKLKVKLNQNKPGIETSSEETGKLKKKEIEKKEQIYEAAAKTFHKEDKESDNRKEERENKEKNEAKDTVEKRETREKDKIECREKVDKKETREKLEKREFRDRAAKKDGRDKGNKRETQDKADKKEDKGKHEKTETREKPYKSDDRERVEKRGSKEKTDIKESREKTDKKEDGEKVDTKEAREKPDKKEDREKVDTKEAKEKPDKKEDKDKKEDREKADKKESRDKMDKKEDTQKTDKKETREEANDKKNEDKVDKNVTREKPDKEGDKMNETEIEVIPYIKDIEEITETKEKPDKMGDKDKVNETETREKVNEVESNGNIDNRGGEKKVDGKNTGEKTDKRDATERVDIQTDKEKADQEETKAKADERGNKEKVDKKGSSEKIEETEDQGKTDVNENKKIKEEKKDEEEEPEIEIIETITPTIKTLAGTTSDITPVLPTRITISPVTMATTTTTCTTAADTTTISTTNTSVTTITKTSPLSPSSPPSPSSSDKERLLHLRQVRHKNPAKTSVTEIISAPPSLTISKVDSNEPPPVRTPVNDSKPSLEIVLVNPSENSKSKKNTQKKSDSQIKFLEPPNGDTPADIFEGVLDLSGKSSRPKGTPPSSQSESKLPTPARENHTVSHAADSSKESETAEESSRKLFEIAETLVSRKRLSDNQYDPFEEPSDLDAAAVAMRNLKTLSDTAVNILMAAQNKSLGTKSETSTRPPDSTAPPVSNKPTPPTNTSTKPEKDCDNASGLKIPSFSANRDRPIPPVPNLQEIYPRGRGRPRPLMSTPVSKPGQNQTVRQIPNPFPILNRHSSQAQAALRSMLFSQPEEESPPSTTPKQKQIPPLQSIRPSYPPPLMSEVNRFPYETLGSKTWSYNGGSSPRGFPNTLEANFNGVRNGDERHNPLRYGAPTTNMRRMEQMSKSIESVAAGLTARAASNPMVDAK